MGGTEIGCWKHGSFSEEIILSHHNPLLEGSPPDPREEPDCRQHACAWGIHTDMTSPWKFQRQRGNTGCMRHTGQRARRQRGTRFQKRERAIYRSSGRREHKRQPVPAGWLRDSGHGVSCPPYLVQIRYVLRAPSEAGFCLSLLSRKEGEGRVQVPF